MKTLIVLSFLILSACGKDQVKNTLYTYGDSVTQGSPFIHPDSNTSYANIVSDNLKMNLNNKAVSGSQMFDNNQYNQIMSDSWEPGSIVIYTPGINDATQHQTDAAYIARYKQGMIDVVNKLKASGVKAYIGTPVRILDNSGLSNETLKIYADINRDVANQSGIKVIDFNNLYVPSTEINKDTVHPNLKGQQIMASIVMSNL